MADENARGVLGELPRRAIRRLRGNDSPEAKTHFVWKRVVRYARGHTTRRDPVLADLAAATRELDGPKWLPMMEVPHEQGVLLTILVAAAAPAQAIEIGTFTGYSALCIARGLPPGGRLLCLDVEDSYTAVAQRHWKAAGVDDRIELRIGRAVDSLAELPEQPTFGLAFVDADKESYITYWEQLLPRMLPGGLILMDNVLWHGRVAYPFLLGKKERKLRRFNDHVAADPRVEHVMLTVATA